MPGGSFDFFEADSVASNTFLMPCSDLRINGFVMIESRPCQIIEVPTSETGKHGHVKVHLVAQDIFTQRRYEDICPSTHKMDVPNVEIQDYELIWVVDDILSLYDPETGETREDLRKPEGTIGEEIDAAMRNDEYILCTVVNFGDKGAVIATKMNTDVDKGEI